MKAEQDLSDQAEKIATIRAAIRQSGDQWRARFPFLKQTNLLGFSIFSLSIVAILGCGWAYLNSHINAVSCIILVAIISSLLHELEHDLIHWQYFKNNKLLHNTMMLGVWLFRPGTINPWIRRHLHLLHHKTSGTPQDLEERGIGNGMPYSPLRWLIMCDPLVGNFVKIATRPGKRKAYRCARLLLAYFPIGVLSALIWWSVIGLHLANFVAASFSFTLVWGGFLTSWIALAEPCVVILIAPHYLRSFCLILVSSSMHYYGNVDSLLKQTQVLNAWYFWPLQLFCFNFGSTHAIHHFVVGEPFYIRQLTASAAHKVMAECGVPKNDLHSFGQANAYPETDIMSAAPARGNSGGAN